MDQDQEQQQPKASSSVAESAGVEQEDIVQPGPSTSQEATTSGDQATVEASSEDNVNEDDDEDDEDIVTIADILKHEEDTEKDIIAVLGNADDKHCSFLMDYVSRQPLYACNTCEMNVDPKTGKKHLAGFCLACSYHCHENHEVFELYTKRNFRCDCGNDKFANTTCKLFGKSGIINHENKYNQNFSGVYCTCSRPYPDPDDSIPDAMIQCAMCEDWFHGRHLSEDISESKATDTDLYYEMVCFACVKKYNFLVYYNEDGCFEEEETSAEDSVNQSALNNEILADAQPESMDSGIVTSVSSSQGESSNEASTNESESICKLAKVKQNYLAKYTSETIEEGKFDTLFLGKNWRLSLCKCASCKEMYTALEIEFITSQADMNYFYEQSSIKTAEEKEDKEDLAALIKMPHVAKIEFLHGFTHLKEKMGEFFNEFGKNKRVVTPEDVRHFFETEVKRKRPRIDMPYNCGTSGR